MGEEAERKTALIAPPDRPRGARPSWCRWARTRSACASRSSRPCAPASRRWPGAQPLVLAFEDIHWADDGMLDAIEHLAQWVRAPLLLVCLARDELLDRRPSWGGGRGSATQLVLEPLTAAETEALVAALLPAGETVPPAVVERSGGNPLFAEEMARRISEDGSMQGRRAARHRAGGARRAPRRARAVRAPARAAGRRRRAHVLGGLAARRWPARTSASSSGRCVSLQEKDILALGAESQLTGERELAFKHVLIRDVAYGHAAQGGPRAEALRGRLVHRGARRRPHRRGRLPARRALRPRGRARPRGGPAEWTSSTACSGARCCSSSRPATPPRCCSPTARRPRTTATRAPICPQDGRADGVRIGEKLGDVSLRLGRVDEAIAVWLECLDWHRVEEDLERVADLHRKIGAALSHKGERKAAIEHYQKGINLLKDGPPRLELVRLYEEAAWLYLHTGDNMLAIYASEKALRLAERLGETRAASRAHGIFGRVFGRIGDTEKARQNLERAVELARAPRGDSHPGTGTTPREDQSETILALSALGRHLEVSEAEVAGARAAYEEALALAEKMGSLPAQVELHASLAQLAVYGADWEQVERSTEASAELAEREGLVGQAVPADRAARPAALARGEARRVHGAVPPRARAGRAGRAGRSSRSRRCSALPRRCATAATSPGAQAALDRALDVCERAGLIAQSIQATAARAVVLMLAHRREAAVEAAQEASELAERLHYPIGRAAALEAQGVCAEDPSSGAELLGEAADAWAALDRPLEAARARLLAGQVLVAVDAERGRSMLVDAAEEIERLGVHHLSERARALAAS